MEGAGNLVHVAQLGQITPPDENWKDENWKDENWKPEWTFDPSSPDTMADPIDPSTALRRESEQSSASAKSTTGRRVDKRDKYREKNRVAAAKCRAKKKEHTDGLEETHRTQSMLNALLKQTEQNLRDELSFWRTQALQHGFCDCHAVQDYNLRKARALAADKDFGGTESAHRDSIAAMSPASGLDANMFSEVQDFDSPDI